MSDRTQHAQGQRYRVERDNCDYLDERHTTVMRDWRWCVVLEPALVIARSSAESDAEAICRALNAQPKKVTR